MHLEMLQGSSSAKQDRSKEVPAELRQFALMVFNMNAFLYAKILTPSQGP